MLGFCGLGRITSISTKAQFPGNYIWKSIITSRTPWYFPSASLCQTLIKEPERSSKYFKHPTPLSIVSKNISTSPALLSDYKKHDHSKLWTVERLLSVILIPVVPAALFSPSEYLDTALAVLIVMHTHFGLEAIIVDYVRPILFGNLAPKIGIGLLYIFSIITLAGLLKIIYSDAGLANTIINVWKK